MMKIRFPRRPWRDTLGSAVLLCALAAACAAPAMAQNLTGAGATFPYPIYSKWFDVYNKKTGVAINYQSIGSGAGIQQVRAGTVDFGASDAPLSDAAMKDMPRRVLHFPMVAGAVVLVEFTNAKLRLFRVPDLLSAAFILATLALVSTFLFR